MKYEDSHHDADRKINNFVVDLGIESDIYPAQTEVIYAANDDKMNEPPLQS